MSEKQERQPIPALTGLRCVAVACVLTTHALATIFYTWTSVVTYNLGAGLGYMGMQIFFTLSGFVIHYNYGQDILSSRKRFLEFLRFFRARFGRIYPLYIFIIVFELVWKCRPESGHFLVPFFLMAQSWYYELDYGRELVFQISYSLNHTWSVSTEWFFYCVYPIVMAALVFLRSRILTGAIMIASTIALYYFLSQNLWIYLTANSYGVHHYGLQSSMLRSSELRAEAGFYHSFARWITYFAPYTRVCEFIIGCLTCQLYMLMAKYPVSRIGRWIAGFCELGALAWIVLLLVYTNKGSLSEFVLGPPNIILMTFGFAPPFAIIMITSARYKTILAWILENRVLQFGGEISYSLYILHLSIFTASICLFDHTWWGLSLACGEMALIMALLTGMAYLFYSWLEMPCRRWVRKFDIRQLKFADFWSQVLFPVLKCFLLLYAVRAGIGYLIYGRAGYFGQFFSS